MKKTTTKISVIGTLLVLSLWLILIMMNREQRPLYNGEVLQEKHLSQIQRLDGWEKIDSKFHLTIEIENPHVQYSLLTAGNSDRTLECNGKIVQGSGYFNIVFSLPDLSESDKGYHLVTNELSEYSVYIAESTLLDTGLLVQKLANCAMLSIMFIMPIYTLSLFLFKKSESYLMYFFTYQCVLLVWGMIRLSPSWNAHFPWWSKFAYGFVWFISMMSLKYCVDVAEISEKHWLRKWTSWRRMAIVTVVYCMVIYQLRHVHQITNTLIYFTCVLITGSAVTRKVKGAGWLFMGSILRVGLAPIVYLYTFRSMLGQECIGYFLLHRTYFIDLPFLLGGMLFINQKFAHQFSESERLAAHLDELVAIRTKELEDAHSERQSMILNITHDLRTPLFVIKNCLGIVEQNPKALADMMPLLQQRSEFVSSLTEDLFLLVKLQEGKLMLNQQRENLSEVLTDLGNMMYLQMGEKQICFDQMLCPDVYVWGDRVRLQQIFQNLITNAYHYTPQGGQISVRMKMLSAEADTGFGQSVGSEEQIMPEEIKGWVRVTVRDSGKGISPADAEHIFDRYFHTKAENKHDSTGLGLSIARELTLLHHGTIDFTSEEGKGTEFCVTLPLC